VSACALLLALVLCAGCVGPGAGLYPPRPGERAIPVYVVAHGWHAGLAVKADDVPDGLWPERRDFRRAEYLEVGWGDRDYWQAEQPSTGMGLRALLLPSPSVVRVVPIQGSLAAAFAGAEIVELQLSPAGFEGLARFVDATFARPEGAPAAPLGPAPWPNSRFYPAHGSYHALRTSNTWTAQALRAGGFPITPAYALTSGAVLSQTRRHGRVIDRVQ
jgi:uncharacterized protein (TIGR02117 family)